MPTTDLANATAIAERIRAAVTELQTESLLEPITASFGVVERVAGEPAHALLRRADVALYEAKRLGRNRVVAA
jgi:diguanylate cyclase (GGDEF)-like protein